MAVGAITIQHQFVFGNKKCCIVDVVGPASYTTTGDALDLYTIGGFSAINFVHTMITAPMPVINGAVITYDRTNKKMQVFGTAANVKGLTETTAATDLSASTYRFFVVGH